MPGTQRSIRWPLRKMDWFHDTEGKAGLRLSSSLHKALYTLKVRYISLDEGSSLCVLEHVCFKVFHRRLVETTKDHVLHSGIYLYCLILPLFTPPILTAPSPPPQLKIMTASWQFCQCIGCLRFSIASIAPPRPFCWQAFNVHIGEENAVFCNMKYTHLKDISFS